jgi:hypothetical protein
MPADARNASEKAFWCAFLELDTAIICFKIGDGHALKKGPPNINKKYKKQGQANDIR